MSLKLKKGVNKQSAYNLRDPNLDYEAAHTLSIIVDNESGVLARVIGLFSGRGYNIESLAVAEVDAMKNISRITIVTTGTPQVIEQIKLQLKKDGTIMKSEILDHERMNRPGQKFYKVLAESALRAVRLCQPLKVPPTGYDKWKNLQLNFNPTEMIKG